jgi:hypothetical protein
MRTEQLIKAMKIRLEAEKKALANPCSHGMFVTLVWVFPVMEGFQAPLLLGHNMVREVCRICKFCFCCTGFSSRCVNHSRNSLEDRKKKVMRFKCS